VGKVDCLSNGGGQKIWLNLGSSVKGTIEAEVCKEDEM
jgi:hypothetical protein